MCKYKRGKRQEERGNSCLLPYSTELRLYLLTSSLQLDKYNNMVVDVQKKNKYIYIYIYIHKGEDTNKRNKNKSK